MENSKHSRCMYTLRFLLLASRVRRYSLVYFIVEQYPKPLRNFREIAYTSAKPIA